MNQIIICECTSVEHQIILRTIDYEKDYLDKCYPSPEQQEQLNDELYIDIHLNKRSFWYRIKYGMKYILGYKCRFGAFDEIITTKTKLKEALIGLNIDCPTTDRY